jgi:hypothetical protein
MARPRNAPRTHARVAEFANTELNLIVNDLLEKRNFKTSAPEVLGALILAARGLPLEIVQALVPSYLERERKELAAGQASDEPEREASR